MVKAARTAESQAAFKVNWKARNDVLAQSCARLVSVGFNDRNQHEIESSFLRMGKKVTHLELTVRGNEFHVSGPMVPTIELFVNEELIGFARISCGNNFKIVTAEGVDEYDALSNVLELARKEQPKAKVFAPSWVEGDMPKSDWFKM
jgi:hypothetical protein